MPLVDLDQGATTRFPVAGYVVTKQCAEKYPHTLAAFNRALEHGAVWAIAAAQRRPDLIGAVAALSVGVVPQRIIGAARSAAVRHYLAAGTLEPGFRRSTRHWAERLAKAGLPCRHEEWIGGHDQVWWEQQLPVALGWLLRA